MTFRKRQNYGDSGKTSGSREFGARRKDEQVGHRDFQGREVILLCDAVMGRYTVSRIGQNSSTVQRRAHPGVSVLVHQL